MNVEEPKPVMKGWQKELLDSAFNAPPEDLSKRAGELEAAGPLVWLKTVFPFAFEDEFSEDHRKYWKLKWSVILRIREQKKYVIVGQPVPKEFVVAEHEWATLLILARGLGKSASIEAGAVMRGTLLDGGYCLYVCETQDQAEEHIANCRTLIDHPESKLTLYYPKMKLADGKGKFATSGEKLKDGQEIFITTNGWICRAKGLNASLRGLRIGNKRPDSIILDDVDGVNDSIAVAKKKIKQISSSIIPTQARRFATIDFGQNLIGEHSVMNQTYTGKAGILAARTVIGVSNAFEAFEEYEHFESYLEADGRVRYRILPTAIPTWAGLDVAGAQKFLNDTGLDTFLAEYMNAFGHLKQEKVYHEFNEAKHLITWSQFEKMFGVRYIPAHWRCGAATDLGYSMSSISAWGFIATSAQNSALPNHHFLYRGRTFAQESIDDQAQELWKDFFPDLTVGRRHFEANQNFNRYPELLRLLKTDPRCGPWLKDYSDDGKRIRTVVEDLTGEDKQLIHVTQAARSFKSQLKVLRMSHEKTGEQKTLAQKYGLPVQKTKDFKAASGVTETNHLLRGDYTQTHPFHPDELQVDANGKPTKLYKLGRPYLFFIVADDQLMTPVDDKGLKRFREDLREQRWTEEVVTENDKMTVRVPGKTNSDCGDSLRMLLADYQTPKSEPLTSKEEVVAALTTEQQTVLAKKGRTMGEQLAIEDALKETEKRIKRKRSPEFRSLEVEDASDPEPNDLGFSL